MNINVESAVWLSASKNAFVICNPAKPEQAITDKSTKIFLVSIVYYMAARKTFKSNDFVSYRIVSEAGK